MNCNLVKLPEMNILNGKSTGLIPAMIVANLNLKSSGKKRLKLHISNCKV